MKIHESLTPSRMSPRDTWYPCSEPDSHLHTFTLVRDMSASFAIEFTLFDQHRKFYSITPHGDRLEELLCFNDYWFMEHKFDDLLSSIVVQMQKTDKVWLELTTWKNADGVIKGISFEKFTPILSWTGSHNRYFLSLSKGTIKPTFFRIPREYAICLSLKDIGLPKRYFSKLQFRLRKHDLPALTDMMLNPQKTHFDFSEYKESKDYDILRDTKEIGWTGGDYSNPNMSESYLIHRIARCKEFRRKLYQYIIKQINRLLCECSGDLGYQGRITIQCSFVPMNIVLEQLSSGKINTTQACDLVLGKGPIA